MRHLLFQNSKEFAKVYQRNHPQIEEKQELFENEEIVIEEQLVVQEERATEEELIQEPEQVNEEVSASSETQVETKIEEVSAEAQVEEKPRSAKKTEHHIHMNNNTREYVAGYLFIGLWLIGVLFFTLWPMLQAFYYSFCDAFFKGNKIVTEFTWFSNFSYAFTKDAQFPTLLRNYALEIVIQVPFAITLALIISLMLNQKIRLRGLWRLIFFLPVIIISGPVMSQLMSQGATSINISDGNIGNFIVTSFPTFLSRIIVLLFDKLIVVLWYTGIPILIFLAGLQKLNKQIYEAASIDGASSWQTFWKITLPSMKPYILVNAVYMIVALSNSTLAQSTSEGTTKTILSYISDQYLTSTGRGYGYACALGIIYLLLILLHIGLYALLFLPRTKVKRKRGH